MFTVGRRSKNISGWLYKVDTVQGISGHWGDTEKMYTPVRVSQAVTPNKFCSVVF